MAQIGSDVNHSDNLDDVKVKDKLKPSIDQSRQSDLANSNLDDKNQPGAFDKKAAHKLSKNEIRENRENVIANDFPSPSSCPVEDLGSEASQKLINELANDKEELPFAETGSHMETQVGLETSDILHDGNVEEGNVESTDGNLNVEQLIRPKKPLSAYFLFTNEMRSTVAEELGSRDIGLVGKRLGELWKSLTDSNQRKYADLAAADKKRYESEMKSFLAAGGSEIRQTTMERALPLNLVAKIAYKALPKDALAGIKSKQQKRRRQIAGKNSQAVSGSGEVANDESSISNRSVQMTRDAKISINKAVEYFIGDFGEAIIKHSNKKRGVDYNCVRDCVLQGPTRFEFLNEDFPEWNQIKLKRRQGVNNLGKGDESHLQQNDNLATMSAKETTTGVRAKRRALEISSNQKMNQLFDARKPDTKSFPVIPVLSAEPELFVANTQNSVTATCDKDPKPNVINKKPSPGVSNAPSTPISVQSMKNYFSKAKVKLRWVESKYQSNLLKSNWKCSDADDEYKLCFADNEILLGVSSGLQPIAVETAETQKSFVKFTIQGGGCDDCDGDEVYQFQLQELEKPSVNGEDNLRLACKSYVECKCGGKLVHDDETHFFALLLAP